MEIRIYLIEELNTHSKNKIQVYLCSKYDVKAKVGNSINKKKNEIKPIGHPFKIIVPILIKIQRRV